MNKNSVKRGLLPYLFLVLIVFSVYYLFNVLNQKVNVLTYDEFVSLLEEEKVTELSITPKQRAVVYEISGKAEDYKENETFFIRVPLSDEIIKTIFASEEKADFELVTNPDPESSTLLLILVNVLPLVLQW